MREQIHPKALLYETILFFFAILALLFLYQYDILLTFILLVAWGIALIFWHTKRDFVYFATAAVAGPIVEIICVKFGVWTYGNPTFLGIPLWLPVVWGEAVMFFTRVADYILEKFFS